MSASGRKQSRQMTHPLDIVAQSMMTEMGAQPRGRQANLPRIQRLPPRIRRIQLDLQRRQLIVERNDRSTVVLRV